MGYQRDPGEWVEIDDTPLLMAVGKMAKVIKDGYGVCSLEVDEATSVLNVLLRYGDEAAKKIIDK